MPPKEQIFIGIMTAAFCVFGLANSRWILEHKKEGAPLPVVRPGGRFGCCAGCWGWERSSADSWPRILSVPYNGRIPSYKSNRAGDTGGQNRKKSWVLEFFTEETGRKVDLGDEAGFQFLWDHFRKSWQR